ncbi:MAG TPA: galactokinase [Ktedonobacteraceae bacterium]
MDTAKLLLPAREAAQRFPNIFQDAVEYVSLPGVAWSPGRVNVIGEHTDYNNGFVLPLAVDRVVAFAGRARHDQVVRLWSAHFQRQVQISLNGLPDTFEKQCALLPDWARYVLGVSSQLAGAGLALRGFDAVINGDVPLGGGMSSSAALEVASAQAFALFADGQWTIGTGEGEIAPMKIAELCQHAEWIASGVKCGILDQAASCLGQARKAILIDCRSLEYRYIPFHAPDISVVVIDTGVRHELASSEYNERREQCEEAVSRLRDLIGQHDQSAARQIQSLRDITPEQFARYKDALPDILRKRAGYVIAENERVLQVVQLLEADDVEKIGPILWQGHAGLRDEYEVSCVELDTLVEIARQVPGVLGARMMGGGFGGCTINLVRNAAVDTLRRAVEEQYPARTGRQASVDICKAAAGSGQAWLK